jgi:hypothetical protein
MFGVVCFLFMRNVVEYLTIANHGLCEPRELSKQNLAELSRQGGPRLRFPSLAVPSTGACMDDGLYRSIRGIRAIRGLLIYSLDS